MDMDGMAYVHTAAYCSFFFENAFPTCEKLIDNGCARCDCIGL